MMGAVQREPHPCGQFGYKWIFSKKKQHKRKGNQQHAVASMYRDNHKSLQPQFKNVQLY